MIYGDEAKRKNRTEGKQLLAVFAPIMLLCAAYFLLGIPAVEEAYHYEVKAEQVFDNDRIDESVKLSELSAEEKELLHDAFKKSDHFFGGGAEVRISREQQFNTFSNWKVIEFRGVYFVASIEETKQKQYQTMWPATVGIVGLLSAVMSLMGLKSVLFPSRRYEEW